MDKRGGARPGAGRKKLHRSHTVSVKIDDELFYIWKSLPNKTHFINECLYDYRMKSQL